MGLAKYGDYLFVADDGIKCVHTIDLRSKCPATVYPSMMNNKAEKKVFENLSGLTIVGQYLILMDFGPSEKPSPCLHIFDLHRADFRRIHTLSLEDVLTNKTIVNPYRLSLQFEEKQSFYIIGNDELVTCTLQLG